MSDSGGAARAGQSRSALIAPSVQEAKDARAQFTALAAGRDEDIDIATAALWLAAESCAGLDVALVRSEIDALATDAGRGLSLQSTRAQRIAAINRSLFGTLRFHGERVDYYDPRNSFLNFVLERRCGIPISLCVLYVSVARANGLVSHGVSFPGHFLAKVGCAPGEETREADVIIDAFEGREIGREECLSRVRQTLGPDANLTEDMLAPASNKEILLRMLSNLKSIFVNTQQYEQALACCDRALLLTPDDPGEYRDRGLIYHRLDCVLPAMTDLARYVELSPDDPGAPAVRELLAQLQGHRPAVH